MKPISHQSTSTQLKRSVKRLIKWGIPDALIIGLAYLFTFSIRTITVNAFDLTVTLPFMLAAVVITLGWLYVFRAYHRAWGQTSGHSATTLLAAVAGAGVTVSLINIALEPRPLPSSVILVANILALTGIVGIRYRSRLLTGLEWRWRAMFFNEFPRDKSHRVLVIGAGESGQTLAWRLRHRFNTHEYKLIGFIDDDPDKLGLYFEDIPVLGNRKTIPEVVQEHHIDLIVVAIHNIDGPDFRDILHLCEQTAARIKVVPDMLVMLGKTSNTAPLRDVLPEDLIGRSVVERHTAVDLRPVTNKRVLVTGAAGSIGSELSRQLPAYEPTTLILLDNNESNLHDLCVNLGAKYPDLNIVQVLADVTDQPSLRRIFDIYDPQMVFHAAAYKHVPILEQYPEEALKVNIGGTLNLADLAHKHKIERFVLISTDKAVKPSSVMGASKRVCETIVRAYNQLNSDGTMFTAVRFGNVLGSRGSVVPTFNRQIDHGGPVTITHPDMTRYFMSISEAVNLVIHAACLTRGDDIFLLRMGEKVRILDIAERMIRLRGLRPRIDVPIEFIGVRPGEKIHEELHEEAEQPGETAHPHIFKLNRYQAEKLDSHHVLTRVQDLIAHGFVEDVPALQTLLNLTVVHYNTSSQDA
jgi:FlaA1/EpsC-like NDP-sugar epimerase